jgi:hypothetical protein
MPPGTRAFIDALNRENETGISMPVPDSEWVTHSPAAMAAVMRTPEIPAAEETEELYSREGLTPEIRPRSPVMGTLGEQSAENSGESKPEQPDRPYYPGDPILFLIDRVERVIEESVQLGTEPLSTKAAVLAALYQAQELRELADHAADISQDLHELVKLLSAVVGSAPSLRDREGQPKEVKHYVRTSTLHVFE